ncbi:Tad domain-containing protein [Marinobacter confluentis]|uniref:Putative Flp pilus-assembly TadG-like N-terminal domain-containing protein n=1 Tax=Marinobacter confluentis TaxID=1697557 RepID=A0A4Z1BX99_9GAMM|nr:Tad domain-containing protein [Marinobacter confluentis]TGN41859.1 hypothetical protein E5Q11_04890 [Marinobacter confluentis]
MRQNQRGQVMPVLMLVVMAVLIVAVVSYNMSRATVSKMELVNAADGAAYSGALQAARSMNFMAYTTRGMVANTIASGYMVAYVSHLRQLADGIDTISRPRMLMAEVIKIAAASYKEQAMALVGAGDSEFADDADEPLLPDGTPLSDDGEPPDDWTDAYEPPGDGSLQEEADDARKKAGKSAGDKFQAAGRAGGAALDMLATTLGYGTIPLTDLLNTAYAGIQLAEYLAMSTVIDNTMSQVALGYGADISVADTTSKEMYAWMLPIRPGLDGFGLSVPGKVDFNLGNHLRTRMASGGSPIGAIAGTISGLAFNGLDAENDFSHKDNTSLSPMDRLIGDTTTTEDDHYISKQRAWRQCFQMVPPVPPINYPVPVPLPPVVPLGTDDSGRIITTPPCTPPFVPPALPSMSQIAIDKTGGSDFFFAQANGSENGRDILKKRREKWEGDPEPDPSGTPGYDFDPFDGYAGDSANSVSISSEPRPNADIAGRANTDASGRRRSGTSSNNSYSDLTETSPYRQAARNAKQAVVEAFKTRLYNSPLGKKSGVKGLATTLARGASWGADWQSEDSIKMGAFIWRPQWSKKVPFIDIKDTLYNSGFDFEGNELAWGGATAKEFWPTYQGVPLYMALMEVPWTDGLSFGLEAREDRAIEVTVTRPISNSSLDLGFMAPPDDGEFQATASAEVFYYRQPADADNPSYKFGGDQVPGYFPKPGSDTAETLSPFGWLAADTISGMPWMDLMKNWYGQKWPHDQIATPIVGKLQEKIGISEELPNLLTPLWDARLVKY